MYDINTNKILLAVSIIAVAAARMYYKNRTPKEKRSGLSTATQRNKDQEKQGEEIGIKSRNRPNRLGGIIDYTEKHSNDKTRYIFEQMVGAQKKCQDLRDEFQSRKGRHAQSYLDAQNEGEKRVLRKISTDLNGYLEKRRMTRELRGRITRIKSVIDDDLKKERNQRKWCELHNGLSAREELYMIELTELGIENEQTTEGKIAACTGEYELYQKMKSMDKNFEEISILGQINEEFKDSSSSWLPASVIMTEVDESGSYFMCNDINFGGMTEGNKRKFVKKFEGEGEQYAPFVFLVDSHYISGALYRSEKGDYSLICLDQLDASGEKVVKVERYISSAMETILEKKININTFGSYDCLVERKEGSPTTIQKDGINCGPLSLAIVKHFNKDQCKEIADGKKDLNDFVKKLDFVKDKPEDGTKKVWSDEDAKNTANLVRSKIYERYGEEFTKQMKKTEYDWATVQTLTRVTPGSPQP